MRLSPVLAAAALVAASAAAAQAPDSFEINVKAFTPAGAPIGEQAGTCTVAKPCRFSWPLDTEGQFKAITVIVKESQPGHLQAIAMHGLASPSVRLPNKPGASASLSAVRSSPTGADVILMKFEIQRR